MKVYISGVSTVDYSVNSVLREREREGSITLPPGNSVIRTGVETEEFSLTTNV